METECEIEEIGLADLTYGDKTLAEWEADLTVLIPKFPMTTHEITNCLISLHNKYQIAYNCFTELQVMVSGKSKDLNSCMNRIISSKLAELKDKPGNKPGKDVLEKMALAEPACKAIAEDLHFYKIILEFFEGNKIKLERVMQLAITVSHSVRGNDKIAAIGSAH